MDAKLIESPLDSGKEPGKWLRHKTTSGSYVSRVWFSLASINLNLF